MYDLSRNYHFDDTSFLISGHRMAEAYIDLAKVYVTCPLRGEANIAAPHVDALLGNHLVAIAAGALCLLVVLVWARRARNEKVAVASADRSALGKSSMTKGALGVEALDADGSGTLGDFSIYGGADGGDETYGEEDEGKAVPGIV
jgi:hypothetical protein